MVIEFSERAVGQIADVLRFIAADKPGAAKKWAAAVEQSVMKLADFPKVSPDVRLSSRTKRGIRFGR